MWLVYTAMRRPITILVAVLTVALASWLAIRGMKVDIFPQLGAPAIYVAQPYGGMDPSQMEGYLTYYYEYHFLYITGLEHVESKNIQGIALMKLVFHQDMDMNQAMAEVVGYVNRARAFMPRIASRETSATVRTATRMVMGRRIAVYTSHIGQVLSLLECLLHKRLQISNSNGCSQ